MDEGTTWINARHDCLAPLPEAVLHGRGDPRAHSARYFSSQIRFRRNVHGNRSENLVSIRRWPVSQHGFLQTLKEMVMEKDGKGWRN